MNAYSTAALLRSAMLGPSANRARSSQLQYSKGATNTSTWSRLRKKRKTTFKSKVISLEPTKHYSFNTLTALLHDNLYTCVPTTGIVQGTAVGNRQGDQVELAALKVKGYFQSAAASNSYQYRIIVGYSGEEFLFPNTFGLAGLQAVDVFHPLTPQWSANGIVNPKAFTVLYDETVDINSLVTATTDLVGISFTIPLNKTFPYQAPGSQFGKNQNLCAIIMGQVNAGASGITATGLASISMDLIFK